MTFREELAAYFEARSSRLRSLRRLAGGASQEVWLVRVADNRSSEREVILRRDAGGALSATARTRFEECVLMKAAHEAGVPVPRVLNEPFLLGGQQAFLMEYVPGETIGRRLVLNEAYAQARSEAPKQAMEALVKIHAMDPERLPFPLKPQTALDLVEALERDLDTCAEGHPAIELGLRWLRLHAPPLERAALVHGDFRLGNFVFGREGLRSILDWELAHVGDPDEDLGWFCVRAWRFGSDHLPAGGIATREDLVKAYRAAGGREVAPERLLYWEIFGNVKWGIVALSQAGRHLRGETRDIELAVLGRLACETEWEMLRLLSEAGE